MRRLFEGGVTNAETFAAGGDYSRAATIRGRRLIDEIQYTASAGKYSGHFVSSLCHTHTHQMYLKDNGNLHLLVGGRDWVYVFEKSSYAVPIC